MRKNFAVRHSFPKFSREFNFADGFDSKFSRDYISRIFAKMGKIREI